MTMAEVLSLVEKTEGRFVFVGIPCFVKAARLLCHITRHERPELHPSSQPQARSPLASTVGDNTAVEINWRTIVVTTSDHSKACHRERPWQPFSET